MSSLNTFPGVDPEIVDNAINNVIKNEEEKVVFPDLSIKFSLISQTGFLKAKFNQPVFYPEKIMEQQEYAKVFKFYIIS